MWSFHGITSTTQPLGCSALCLQLRFGKAWWPRGSVALWRGLWEMNCSSWFCLSQMLSLATDIVLCLAHNCVLLTVNGGVKRERARKLNYCPGFRAILQREGRRWQPQYGKVFRLLSKLFMFCGESGLSHLNPTACLRKKSFIGWGEGGKSLLLQGKAKRSLWFQRCKVMALWKSFLERHHTKPHLPVSTKTRKHWEELRAALYWKCRNHLVWSMLSDQSQGDISSQRFHLLLIR